MAEELALPKTESENNPVVAIPQAATGKNLISDLYTGTSEETFFKSPAVADSYRSPYNSDDIWQKTGDYSIYEDMLKDDQVSVCLKLKKDLVIGSGYDLVSEEEGQDEIIEDLKKALDDDCEVPFLESIEEILSAYEFGFSLTEKVFKINDDGKLRIKCLKTRHPNSWLLHQDVKGNVEKYEQNTVEGKLAIEPRSLIHFVNNRKFQNPYGVSDLRAAYNAWFTKRQVIRYFGIFLEKAASPVPVATYDKNAPAGTNSRLLDILKKFQAKTALVIPKEIEVQFLEAKNTGEAYSRAIDIFNLFIGRAMFIPDLLGISGSETSGGSHSLGIEQIKLFFLHIFRRRGVVEKIINRHFVLPLVRYNFGNVEKIPKFRFKPLDDMQAVELAKVWLEAVKGKVYKPNEEEINYFRNLVKFPEGDVEFEEPAPSPFGVPLSDQTSEDPKNAETVGQSEEVEEPEEIELEKKQSFGKVFNQVPGDYHKKVNFKAIEDKLNDYDQSVSTDVQPILKKIFSDLYDQIERKKIIQNSKVDRIDSLNLKYLKELKQVLKTSFLSIYKDGQSQASQEIFKSNFRAPITSEKFLEILENETFQYVGDLQYTILKRVRSELVAAVKDGKPLSAVLDLLDIDGKKLAETSIERFARTKHTEVLNKGRHAFFEDSGVISGYQYSAILDDVTSGICRGLHGKKFKAGDEPIPPLHFNCRSMLIPITKFEEFNPDESVGKTPIGDFIEENKGEGFAVK